MSFEGVLISIGFHAAIVLAFWLLARWHIRVASEIWEGMKKTAREVQGIEAQPRGDKS